jgi:hypothetical protein
MHLKAARTEVLWLVGCYAVSFLLLGVLAGSWFFWQSTLDIQMHNTYFVVSNTLATVPLFLVVALVVTGTRAIAEPLRTQYTWAVLLLLGLAVMLIILFIVLIAKKILR